MAEVEKVKFTLRMDATLSVTAGDEQHWIKPGAESTVVFAGLPEKEQIAVAAEYMQKDMLEPTLDKVIEQIHDQLMSIAGSYNAQTRKM